MSSPKRISFLCPGRTQRSLLCVHPIPSGDCGSVAPFRLHRMAEPLSRVWNRCKWSGWEVVKSNSSKQVWIRFCFVKAPSLGGSAGKRRDRFVDDVSFQGVLNTINTERLGGEAVVRSARHDGFASFFPDGCFSVRLNGDWVSEGLVLHAATVFRNPVRPKKLLLPVEDDVSELFDSHSGKGGKTNDLRSFIELS